MRGFKNTKVLTIQERKAVQNKEGAKIHIVCRMTILHPLLMRPIGLECGASLSQWLLHGVR